MSMSKQILNLSNISEIELIRSQKRNKNIIKGQSNNKKELNNSNISNSIQNKTTTKRFDQKQKQNNKILMYQIPQIQSYKLVNRPLLTQQKKRNIIQKLNLQKQSLLKHKDRIIMNQYFVNYDYNPFFNLLGIQNKSSIKKQIEDNKNTLKQTNQIQQNVQINKITKAKPFDYQKSVHQEQFQRYQNIVYALDQLKQKSEKQSFMHQLKKFKAQRQKVELFSHKIINKSKILENLHFQIQKKKQQQKLKEKNNQMMTNLMLKLRQKQTKKKSYQSNPNLIQLKNTKNHGILAVSDSKGKQILDQFLGLKEIKFDQILKIRQDNYYFNYQKYFHYDVKGNENKFNIFKLAYDPSLSPNNINESVLGTKYIMMNKNILCKNNFNTKSIVQKVGLGKTYVFRQISDLARIIITNKPGYSQIMMEHIEASEMTFKLDNLNFGDVMNVATNRFNSEFVNQMIFIEIAGQNKVKDHTQISQQSVDINNSIIYEENSLNKGFRFCTKNEQQNQINTFLHFQNQKQPPIYVQIYQRFQSQIITLLNKKMNLISSTVFDKIQHSNVNRQVLILMKQFINHQEQQKINVQKYIRANKIKKQNYVGIKLEKFLELLKKKGEFDKIISKFQSSQQFMNNTCIGQIKNKNHAKKNSFTAPLQNDKNYSILRKKNTLKKEYKKCFMSPNKRHSLSIQMSNKKSNNNSRIFSPYTMKKSPVNHNKSTRGQDTFTYNQSMIKQQNESQQNTHRQISTSPHKVSISTNLTKSPFTIKKKFSNNNSHLSSISINPNQKPIQGYNSKSKSKYTTSTINNSLYQLGQNINQKKQIQKKKNLNSVSINNLVNIYNENRKKYKDKSSNPSKNHNHSIKTQFNYYNENNNESMIADLQYKVSKTKNIDYNFKKIHPKNNFNNKTQKQLSAINKNKTPVKNKISQQNKQLNYEKQPKLKQIKRSPYLNNTDRSRNQKQNQLIKVKSKIQVKKGQFSYYNQSVNQQFSMGHKNSLNYDLRGFRNECSGRNKHFISQWED